MDQQAKGFLKGLGGVNQRKQRRLYAYSSAS
jgi:hypothetical protein